MKRWQLAAADRPPQVIEIEQFDMSLFHTGTASLASDRVTMTIDTNGKRVERVIAATLELTTTIRYLVFFDDGKIARSTRSNLIELLARNRQQIPSDL